MGGTMATIAYDRVISKKKHAQGSDLARFSKALEKQLQDEYEITFSLGQLLLTRRQELQLSQSELADETGIPQADISRIECGKSNPTIKTVEKILDALDLKLIVTNK